MDIKPEEYNEYCDDLNFRSNALIGPKAAFELASGNGLRAIDRV